MSTAAPPTAKIVRFHRTGGPEVLQLDELPLPEPAAGEVRLRVKAIGLNRAEVLFRMGRYLVQPILPSKIGYEASGTVEAAGPDVDPSWIGKTVSTVPAFLASAYGVYGEVAIVPVSAIAEYPGRLSYEEGTSIWMQYLTAYGALIHQGRLAKGDFVLITAASSSVGIAAIEIAKAEGAISIATTRTSRKKAELLSLGADYVIATEEEDLAARVNQITAGKGARIAFDPVGGKGLEALAAAAAQGAPANRAGGRRMLAHGMVRHRRRQSGQQGQPVDRIGGHAGKDHRHEHRLALVRQPAVAQASATGGLLIGQHH